MKAFSVCCVQSSFVRFLRTLAVCFGMAAGGQAAESRYEAGWFPWDPYQFMDADSGRVSGLNIELARAVFERMNLSVEWRQVDWQAHLERMARGESAIAVGASKTPEREAYAWFSEPFFEETIVYVGRKGEVLSLNAASVDELLRLSVAEGRRLAVIGGYFYGDEVMEFLDTVPSSDLVITPDDVTSLRLLLDGTVDGFLADRLATTTVAWRIQELESIKVHPLEVGTTPLYAMFSKEVFDASIVDEFNQAFAEVKASGEFRQIKQHYILPVLLEVTLHTNWFLIVTLIGTFVFALSGVIIARKEGYDVSGAFLLASLPALGGGILRDILIDRHPVWALRPPLYYIYMVLGVVIIGALAYKGYDWLSARRPNLFRKFTGKRPSWPGKMVNICDALGLAAFTVIAVVIAVEQRLEPLWLWGALLAALTGAGGGIVRDVIRGKSEDSSLRGNLYPEIAFVWGLLFAIFLEWQIDRLQLAEIAVGMILVLLGAFATRMLVIRYDLRSPLLSRKISSKVDV